MCRIAHDELNTHTKERCEKKSIEGLGKGMVYGQRKKAVSGEDECGEDEYADC